MEDGGGETEEALVKRKEEGCDSFTGWKVCGEEEKPAKLRLWRSRGGLSFCFCGDAAALPALSSSAL